MCGLSCYKIDSHRSRYLQFTAKASAINIYRKSLSAQHIAISRFATMTSTIRIISVLIIAYATVPARTGKLCGDTLLESMKIVCNHSFQSTNMRSGKVVVC